MQLPKRRAQLLKIHNDQDEMIPMTQRGYQKLVADLEDLEKHQRPQAISDVSVAVQKGDLSENAEYTEAKFRLANIDGRIFSIKERLKRASIIEAGSASGAIRLGSSVTLRGASGEKTYHIVGPHESNPSRGRISHVSPLGAALMGHSVGDTVTIETPRGKDEYIIQELHSNQQDGR